MQLKPNTLLQGGKYRIVKELGSGGFGITYKAVQVSLNRYVAIKEFFMKDFCVRGSSSTQMSVGSEGSRRQVERYRKKFLKEARTIAQFKHPHIIGIHDVFEENGTAYYVMDFLEEGSLNDYLKKQGRLSETEALYYIRQIADALDYIHQQNINHLDVKPGNIMLDEKHNAVLIDFGLAKSYDGDGNQESTTPVGVSAGYAPTEQYMRGGVGKFSPETDIYSLGATLYKLVTGKTPPEAQEVTDYGLPTFPSFVFRQVASAITQAMQPRRVDRPHSIGAFLQLLQEVESSSARKMDAKERQKVYDVKPVITEPIITKPIRNNKLDSKSLFGNTSFLDFIGWNRNRHWFVNLSIIAYILCSFEYSIVMNYKINYYTTFTYHILFLMYYLLSINCAIMFWHNYKNMWYLPVCFLPVLMYFCHDSAPFYVTTVFPYLMLLAIMQIRYKGRSAFYDLKVGKWSDIFVLRDVFALRPIFTNVIVLWLIFVSLIGIWGLYTNLNSEYVEIYDILLYNMIIICYSLFLIFSNYRCGLVISVPPLIFTYFNMNYWPSSSVDDIFITFYKIVVFFYIILIASLFVRKNGRTAWSLMR